MMPGITIPLDRTEMLTGLAVGTVALAIGLLASIGARALARPALTWGSAGLLFAAAALVGLDLTHDAPGGLVGGTALVAVGAGIAAAAGLPLAPRLAGEGALAPARPR